MWRSCDLSHSSSLLFLFSSSPQPHCSTLFSFTPSSSHPVARLVSFSLSLSRPSSLWLWIVFESMLLFCCNPNLIDWYQCDLSPLHPAGGVTMYEVSMCYWGRSFDAALFRYSCISPPVGLKPFDVVLGYVLSGDAQSLILRAFLVRFVIARLFCLYFAVERVEVVFYLRLRFYRCSFHSIVLFDGIGLHFFSRSSGISCGPERQMFLVTLG